MRAHTHTATLDSHSDDAVEYLMTWGKVHALLSVKSRLQKSGYRIILFSCNVKKKYRKKLTRQASDVNSGPSWSSLCR